MKYQCQKCGQEIAEKKETQQSLVPLNGSILVKKSGEVPKVRCSACGLRTIFLEGSL